MWYYYYLFILSYWKTVSLIPVIEKYYNEPGDLIFENCKDPVRKLMNNFFTTVAKESEFKIYIIYYHLKIYTLTRHLGPMYINFDAYPPYTGAVYDFFLTNINSHIEWCSSYPYSTPKESVITWINKNSW